MAESADQNQTPSAPTRGKRRKLVWIFICVASIVAGATLPVVFGAHKLFGSSPPAKKSGAAHEQVAVPFGDVAVNLAEARMTRYLRLKIVLMFDGDEGKDAPKLVEKRKVAMKDWLIGHLAGKTLKDVTGTVGVRRIQREIHERFDEMLFPEGDHKPFDVLFEEFVVQ